MKINYARIQVINPALKKQYSDINYEVKHVVGIDVSTLRAARTGVRGNNDLVWVGRAANHAAKLSSLSTDYPTWITKDVYDSMNKSTRISSDGRNMWEKMTWNDMGKKTIYRSSWNWRVE